MKLSSDLCPVGGDALDYCKAYSEEVKAQNKTARSVFVSCWTEREKESYLMWKAYALNYDVGVRIETTVRDFLTGLKNNPCKIFCSRVTYGPEVRRDTLFKKLFYKKEEYADEKEVRICVFPNEDQRLFGDYIMMDVSENFINSLTLSPFLPIDKIKELTIHFKEPYPELKVYSSQIIETI